MNGRTWMLDAAEEIHLQYDKGFFAEEIEHRVAEIIATCAEPLVTLLRESRRKHYHCDDSWYCCGACTSLDHEGEPSRIVRRVKIDGRWTEQVVREPGTCTCGADAWNARIEAALAGAKPLTAI